MNDFERSQTTYQSPKENTPSWFRRVLALFGYLIPALFFAYILYIHYLPFGYHQTFTLDVGGQNDTNRDTLYLIPSPDLSPRMITPERVSYRTLSGYVDAIFTSPVFLDSAEVTISIDDPTITLTPPTLTIDPASQTWNHAWDFKNDPHSLGFEGNAFTFDDSVYFDGNNRLELPNTADQFETGPFTLYTEWTPNDITTDRQQIIGHFNWEIYQNSDSVVFRVGRMDESENGPFYSVSQPVASDFFNVKHTLLAVYNPDPMGRGYILMYVDGLLSGKTYFGTSTILADYGSVNLTLGKSVHSGSEFFTGSVYGVYLRNDTRLLQEHNNTFSVHDTNEIPLSLYTSTPTHLRSITVTVTKE